MVRARKVAKPATPRQKVAQAKWQAAGVAARKAKAAIKPQAQTAKVRRHNVEMVTLYHATTRESAEAIKREGFTWVKGRNRNFGQWYPDDPVYAWQTGVIRKPIWFSTKPPSIQSGPSEWVHEKFGFSNFDGDILTRAQIRARQKNTVVLTVKVRKTLLHHDYDAGKEDMDTIPSKVVSADALKGVKVRVWHPTKRRKAR